MSKPIWAESLVSQQSIILLNQMVAILVCSTNKDSYALLENLAK